MCALCIILCSDPAVPGRRESRYRDKWCASLLCEPYFGRTGPGHADTPSFYSSASPTLDATQNQPIHCRSAQLCQRVYWGRVLPRTAPSRMRIKAFQTLPGCAGSVATQIQFDTSGASPVSAASPLAPAVTKLWNAPRAYYSEDYAINGVRTAACLKPALFALVAAVEHRTTFLCPPCCLTA